MHQNKSGEKDAASDVRYGGRNRLDVSHGLLRLRASRAPAATTGSMHSITGWKPRDSLGRPHDKATGGLALDKNDAFVKDTEMLRYRLALLAAATSWMPARAAAQAP